MNRAELRERLQGVVGVTVTPFDDDYEVDYGRMADITRWWVENGLVKGKAMLKVASVMGEGPQMRDDEWPALVRTVVQAADGKVDIIAGTHCKDTKRTIEDARRAQDLGAVGLQIAPPIFNDPDQDDMLRFYEAVSDAIEIGVMVYQNHWLPYGGIEAGTFHKMADFEHIVAITWASYEGCPDEAMVELAPKFNLIENGNDRVGFHKRGGRGFLDKTAVAYPPYELKMWDLLEAGRYDEAQAMWEAVDVPLAALGAKIRERSGGQARFKKALMNVMGHRVGHQRPPSLPPTDAEMDDLRELLASFGWPVPNMAATGVPAD
jgi:4-hydroxy-tetrahydrodipicolinate synthase